MKRQARGAGSRREGSDRERRSRSDDTQYNRLNQERRSAGGRRSEPESSRDSVERDFRFGFSGRRGGGGDESRSSDSENDERRREPGDRSCYSDAHDGEPDHPDEGFRRSSPPMGWGFGGGVAEEERRAHRSDGGYRSAEQMTGSSDQRGWLQQLPPKYSGRMSDFNVERRVTTGPQSYGVGGTRASRGSFAGIGPRSFARSKERIIEDLNQRLTDHHDIDPTEIEVDFENGEAILRGRVETRTEKRMAEDIADEVPGVCDVRNELRVGAQRTESTAPKSRDTDRGGERKSDASTSEAGSGGQS